MRKVKALSMSKVRHVTGSWALTEQPVGPVSGSNRTAKFLNKPGPDTGKQYCLTKRIPVRKSFIGMFGSSRFKYWRGESDKLLVCDSPDSEVWVLHEDVRETNRLGNHTIYE